MTFNPDPNKQVQEVVFSRKINKTSEPPLNLNNNSVKQVQFQKLLGVYMDDKLDFCEHFRNIFKMVNRTINLLHKLQNTLPRAPLVTTYKSSVRRHLDYVHILYNQMFNSSLHEKLESIQDNAHLQEQSLLEVVPEKNFIKN